MVYIQQDWEDVPSTATPIDSARLEHMEQGIFAAHVAADEALAVVGDHVTWNPLLSADPGTSWGLWTGGTGGWSVNTAYGINVSTTGSNQHNTWSGLNSATMRWRAIRATVRFSVANGTGSWIGFGFATNSSGWNAGDVGIGVNSFGIQWEANGVGGSFLAVAGLTIDTDIDLYIIEDRFNDVYLVYVNGVFVYPVPLSYRHNQGKITLYSQGLAGSFRNIWIWNGLIPPNLPQAP